MVAQLHAGTKDSPRALVLYAPLHAPAAPVPHRRPRPPAPPAPGQPPALPPCSSADPAGLPLRPWAPGGRRWGRARGGARPCRRQPRRPGAAWCPRAPPGVRTKRHARTHAGVSMEQRGVHRHLSRCRGARTRCCKATPAHGASHCTHDTASARAHICHSPAHAPRTLNRVRTCCCRPYSTHGTSLSSAMPAPPPPPAAPPSSAP